MATTHSNNAREYISQEWNQNRFLASGGYWSTGAAAAAIHKVGSSSLAVAVTNQCQFESTASLKNLQLDSSQLAIRRRSHRPRGCRGGRKNRKFKDSSVAGNESVSPQSPFIELHNQTGCDDDTLEKQTFVKGDLSPYHHVKVNNAWNFGSQNYHNAPLPTAKYSQMLPPPVPSALFESHRSLEENKRMGLKMLPSFDDSDESAEGSLDVPPPPPPSQRYMAQSSTQQCNETDCEATADTAFCSSHSRSASDDCDESSMKSWNGEIQEYRLIHQGEYSHLNPTKSNMAVAVGPPKFAAMQTNVMKSEGSSLFVTSPRSFLLGIPTTAAVRLQNSHTGKGFGNGQMMENVPSSNISNLQIDPPKNATQTKRRW
jgi:hypothetical protein